MADDAPSPALSHAAKMLAAIEATLEGRATAGQLDTVRIAHHHRDWQTNPELLLQWRDRYRAEVQREQQAAALAAGTPVTLNRLRVRF